MTGSARRSVLETAAIITIYALVFFGALPLLLWESGRRFDELLALPPPGAPATVVGLALALVGGAFLGVSMAALVLRGKGLPISHLPPALLVVRSPYAIVRHPIYAGYTAVFAGAGLASGSLGRGLLAAALLAAGAAIYALGFEEPRLVRRFGWAYLRYRLSVPRFPWRARTRARRLVRTVFRAARVPFEALARRPVLFRMRGGSWMTCGLFDAAGSTLLSLLWGGSLVAGGMEPPSAALLAGGAGLCLVAGARAAGPVRAHIAAVLLVLVFARVTGTGALWILDRAAIAWFPARAIAALGCIARGCCHGRPCVHGMRWPAGGGGPVPGGARGLRRAPTQLLSAMAWLCIVLILAAAASRPAPDGTVLAAAILLHSLASFWIECLRDPVDRPRTGSAGLTSGQVGSSVSAVLGFALLFALDAPAGRSVTLLIDASPAGMGWIHAAALLAGATAFLLSGCSRGEARA